METVTYIVKASIPVAIGFWIGTLIMAKIQSK